MKTRIRHAPRISDEAVIKSTGKSWSEWFAWLDSRKADRLTHQEVAQMLVTAPTQTSFWWAQSITNEYEKFQGKRVVGDTVSSGFQIGVQKSLSVTPESLWKQLMSPQGLHIWLGKIDTLPLQAKARYRTKNGTLGEVRTFREGSFIRLTWQPKAFDKPSTLQVRVQPRGNKTQLQFHQEKLANAQQRKEMRKHWQQVSSRIESIITTS